MKIPFAISRIRAVAPARGDGLRSMPAPDLSAARGRSRAARSLLAVWRIDPDTGRLDCRWGRVADTPRRGRAYPAFAWATINGQSPAYLPSRRERSEPLAIPACDGCHCEDA